MQKLLSSALLWLAVCRLGAEGHAYGGVPTDNPYLVRNAYLIEYDLEHRTPRWVAYHVKQEYLDRPPREGQWDDFRDDPDIEGEARDSEYDGAFSGPGNYARGHLVPYYVSGGDRDSDGTDAEDGDADDAETVFEIMYMSNIAPQHHYEFNGSGGLWYGLETYVRNTLLKKQGRDVWVFAGCIYGPGAYDEIGNGIEVPPV